MSGEKKQTNAVRVERIAFRTAHAELFSAFEYGEVLTCLLHVPRELRDRRASLHLFRDEDGRELIFEGEEAGDAYRFVVDTVGICREERKRGLFFCEYRVGEVVISQNEYGDGYILSDLSADRSRFQLSVYAEGTNKPTGYEGGIMYQIFPDRFACRGEPIPKEGAVIEEDWYAPISEYAGMPGEPLLNNHFFGGNLGGIVDKLDMLKDLGVTLIYLNPIFRAFSNHRYDTGSYEEVDATLGGNAALEELIAEAKKRGIGLILDGVFNHTGSDSRYFNKYGRYPSLGAYQSKESPYFDWYFFRDYPDRYECWWGIDILPKVNCENPSYRSYIAGRNGIVEKYLGIGAAGWRLDVADELSDGMLDDIRAATKRANPSALIYGEVWEDASNKIAYSQRRRYFTSGQLDGVMNYPLKNAIIAYLRERDAAFLFHTMRILYAHYPKAVSDMQMNVLGTHDTERILTVLAGSPEGYKANSELAHAKLTAEQRAAAKKKLKLAVLLQMTLPGIPCIYYGDEAGMEGYRDPFNRQTYPWGREDGEVFAYYREITALRRSLPMLADAYYRGISHDHGVYIYERFNDRARLTVIVNLSGRVYLYENDDVRSARILPGGEPFDGSRCITDGSALLLYTDPDDQKGTNDGKAK